MVAVSFAVGIRVSVSRAAADRLRDVGDGDRVGRSWWFGIRCKRRRRRPRGAGHATVGWISEATGMLSASLAAGVFARPDKHELRGEVALLKRPRHGIR